MALPGLRGREHRAGWDEVDVAACAPVGILQFAAAIAYVSHLQQTLPWRDLVDGGAPAIGIRLVVVL